MKNDLMNAEQAAACLLTSKEHIIELAGEGRLPCVRRGNEMLFDAEMIFHLCEEEIEDGEDDS